jgi:carboxylate-amine ligase
LGVEEEYHLVDAETMALADAPDVVPEAIALLGGRAQGEISTSQLEVASSVLTTLADVRREVLELRRGADAAAQRHGCRILPTGTHPSGSWRDQALTPERRYEELVERFGLLALQQLITGMHVHVAVPDGDLAVQVLDRLRPDLPVLLALSGSSPFWEGVDTGYAAGGRSTTPASRSPARRSCSATGRRTTGSWPTSSPPVWCATPATSTGTRACPPGSHDRVRVADVCPHVDDVVLQAGLGRALVREAARAAVTGTPFAHPRPELVRAAAGVRRGPGLEGELLDLHVVERRPAADVVRGLVHRLRDDLEEAGEWDEVHALAEQALARGTSAAEQPRTHARTGDLAAVVRSVVDRAVPA